MTQLSNVDIERIVNDQIADSPVRFSMSQWDEVAVIAREAIRAAIGTEEERLCYCGLAMSRNPHPDAGLPGHVATVGASYVCIPCTVEALSRWAERAHSAERELADIPRLESEDVDTGTVDVLVKDETGKVIRIYEIRRSR